MIGCDHCEEWYHGPCIGISESKADRVEKFTCIRCSTKQMFHGSATVAVGIIRKWTCRKDLKKARQVEFQKLQRKDRKEKKDTEKFTNSIIQLEFNLSQLKRKDQTKKSNSTIMEFESTFPGRDSIKKKKEDRAEKSDDPSTNIVSLEDGESANTINADVPSNSNETTNISKNLTGNAYHTTVAKNKSKGNTTEVICVAAGDMSKAKMEGISVAVRKEEGEILLKLDKLRIALKQSKVRLDKVAAQSQERLRVEAKEDKYSNILRNWCLKIRSEVLVPSTEAQSLKTRPQASGIMPPIMPQVIAEARDLGISELPDVKKMIDCFKSICWSFSAMYILRRKPSISHFRHLIAVASKFKLPDEKAFKTIKFMANKASQWQTKVRKAISPKAGEKKSFNVSMLQGLQCGIRELPLVIPEEQILRNVIEDNGARHCKCGGPRDENRMLKCASCDKKIHLACIITQKSGLDKNEKWVCPCCGIENIADGNMGLAEDAVGLEGLAVKNVNSEDGISPHAPDPNKLWPPFGLKESLSAVEAFGSDCLAIPDIPNIESNKDNQTRLRTKIDYTAPSNKVFLSSEVLRKDESSTSDIQSCRYAPTENVASEAESKHKAMQLCEQSCPPEVNIKSPKKLSDSRNNHTRKIENKSDSICPASQSKVPNTMRVGSIEDCDAVVVPANLSSASDTSFSASCGSQSKNQWTDKTDIPNNDEELTGVVAEQCPEVSS